jgi:hypothetical protein
VAEDRTAAETLGTAPPRRVVEPEPIEETRTDDSIENAQTSRLIELGSELAEQFWVFKCAPKTVAIEF